LENKYDLTHTLTPIKTKPEKDKSLTRSGLMNSSFSPSFVTNAPFAKMNAQGLTDKMYESNYL